jgi:glycosyltransferase involved in cell wall biosynthesis
MVSTNNSAQPCRKAYPEAFAAFAMFAQDHPNALLYVHAEKVGLAGGMELDICAQGRGIRPDQLAFVDQYRYRSGAISQAELAWIYSAFDVMLFPSMGEGFGIPAVEAQACGTPIIVSDFSAQSELVAPFAGYLVASQPYWDSAQAADFCVPSIADLTAALEHAYGHPDQLRTAAETCRTFAEGYDADQVFEQHWVPILEHMESEMPSVAPISL